MDNQKAETRKGLTLAELGALDLIMAAECKHQNDNMPEEIKEIFREIFGSVPKMSISRSQPILKDKP